MKFLVVMGITLGSRRDFDGRDGSVDNLYPNWTTQDEGFQREMSITGNLPAIAFSLTIPLEKLDSSSMITMGKSE